VADQPQSDQAYEYDEEILELRPPRRARVSAYPLGSSEPILFELRAPSELSASEEYRLTDLTARFSELFSKRRLSEPEQRMLAAHLHNAFLLIACLDNETASRISDSDKQQVLVAYVRKMTRERVEAVGKEDDGEGEGEGASAS
jgi:hypothetical protein